MKRLLVAIMLAVIGGCSQPSTSVPNSAPEAAPLAHNTEDAKGPKLNAGQKWNANPETTAGVQAMLKIVEEAETGPSPLDSKAVKAALTTELEKIFKKCTMTGPGHDNLHQYLVPLMDSIDKLGKQDSTDETVKLVSEIKRQLSAYEEYFE